MVELHRKKRVEVVADASMADELVSAVERAGATGYTLVHNVSGKGHRGVRHGDDPFDVLKNVILIVVTSDAVAERIMDFVIRDFADVARVAWVSDVHVARESHF